jgi:hypothetical protein
VPAASSLPDGTYTAQASQSDSDGNTGTSSSTTFVVDTMAPVITLNSVASPANNNVPTFSGTAGTATGDSSTVTVKIYSGSTVSGGTLFETLTTTAVNGSYSVPATSPLSPNGTYTAQASQSDSAGNAGTSSSTTFVVNTTAPVITLDSVTSPTNNNEPTFSGTAGTATGDSNTVTVKIYSGSTVGGTPFETLTTTAGVGGSYSVPASSPFPDGTYTAQASQSDSSGNTGTSSSTTFVVDTTAPLITLNSLTGLTNPTNNNVPTFSGTAGTAAGDSSTVTINIYSGSTVGGTPFETLTTTADAGGSYSVQVPATSPLSPDGVYTAQASQSDSVGNTGTSSITTFLVDTTAPVIALNSVTNPTNNNKPTFSGTAGILTGDSSTVTINIYSGSTVGGTPFETLTTTAGMDGSYSVQVPATSPLSPDGTYTAQASQSDSAGNTGTSSNTTFVVDTVAPVITLNSVTSPTKNNEPTFSGTAGTAAGDSSTVTIKIYSGSTVGGTPFETLTTTAVGGSYSVQATSPLSPDDTYTAQASQSDDAGNTGVSAPTTFLVDTTAPIVTITGKPSNPIASNTAPFSYTGDDGTGSGVAHFLYRIDGGNFSSDATGAHTFTGLLDGSHTFGVEAVDVAGNISSEATYTWAVDTTAPTGGTVRDGLGADIAFQPSTTKISANWSGFTDGSGTGIAGYQWAIGTTPGGTDVQAYTSVGPATSATNSALALTNGTTYYVSVQAVDQAGNVSVAATSDGVKVIVPALVSVFRPSTGQWFLDQALASYGTGATTRQFNFATSSNSSTNIPVTGDWNGNGLKDVGVFQPSTGQWLLDTGNKDMSHNPAAAISFGTTGDVPIVGHWLGGNIDYIGVWRPSTGTFFLSLTNTSFDENFSSDSNHLTFQWGTVGDMPVVGDWNSSGISQVGVFRPSDPAFGGAASWYLDQGNVAFPANNMPVIPAFTFGTNGDIPVVGHWLGGNDLAGVWRPSSGTFFLSKTNTSFDGAIPSDSNHLTFQWGGAGDTPVVGDWNGDGISDVGVFRPSDPTFGGKSGWYLDQGNVAWSNSAPPTIAPFQFGGSSDRPAAGAWQLAGLPQLLDGAPGDGGVSLSIDQLQAVTAEALGNWQAAGLSASQLAMLQGAQFDVTNLPSGWLGESLGNVIMIDATADGHGWSVGGPMAGQVDLLTVVEHEMGHLLGLSDVTAGAGSANLMSETLAPGMRRGPDGNVSLADPSGASIITSPSVSLAALSSADTESTRRGADTPNTNWSSLDRYFAASLQVNDAVPDGIVDGRLATSTWRDNAETGQIQEERDDFFAAIA